MAIWGCIMWQEWIDHLWQDHLTVNPQAGVIRDLLRERGEVIVNDHIALRTFGHPDFDIKKITPLLIRLGYQPCATYRFEQKKLLSQHFEHLDAAAPKVFVSELQLERLSEAAQFMLGALLAQVEVDLATKQDFCYRGCPWSPITRNQYRDLYAETEVGAWLATMGFRANHFTVRVNDLTTFTGLADLNEFLKNRGFKLNTSGGEIKGSPRQGLEQSSTLAHRMMICLADGELELPTCYDEFAERHRDHQGIIFEGFLTDSADKIFESTN